MTQQTQLRTAVQPTVASTSLSRQFVVFSLGGQQFCIDIMAVREIRVVQSITALPGAAEHVRGIINLRGTIIPVIDLRKRFGLGDTVIAANQSLVIAGINGQPSALLVDEVSDILSSTSCKIDSESVRDGSLRSPFFEGLIFQDDTMLIVIDLDRIIQAEAKLDA